MYACPHCQQGIRAAGERCSSCGSVFDPGLWPQEAYATKGMAPRISFSWRGGRWEPTSADFVIGRRPGFSGLELSGYGVEKQHVRIALEDGEWTIRPLAESIVKLNSQDVECGRLNTGDEIQIGSYLLTASIVYIPATVASRADGRLRTATEQELNPADERYYIGGDSACCQIVVADADPVHAILYHRPADKSWWLVDNASSSGVKVNGARIRNTRLCPGDSISISGVDFLFQGKKLVCGRSDAGPLTLSFENVSATAANGFKILKDLNFRIEPGEFVGVLGPSGCGKSSVIQRIVGLAQFSEGDFLINGRKHAQLPEAYLDTTAYLPQQNVLHDDLTLKQEFSCFRSLHAQADAPITDDAIEQALRLVGLEGEIDKKVSQLSGGQQRRAGIALSLLRDPRLLVLDEPTSGLDPATETEVMTYLRRVSNQHKTVVCSTHIMGNLDLFDKILLLARGRLVFYGTPGELLEYFKTENPLSLYRLFASGSFDEQCATAELYAEKYSRSQFFRKYKVSSADESGLPPPRRLSFRNQVWGYWKRMLFELLGFRSGESVWKTFRAFWTSSCFLQLILQPVLIAFVLKLACAESMTTHFTRKEVLFFAGVTVFWLGLNNSVRELVKERIPWRCLERLQRIPTLVYLFGKISFVSALSFLQALVFSGVFFELQFGNEKFALLPTFELQAQSAANLPAIIPFVGGIFVVLFLVCMLGAWIGLAVSALFKKESAAVAMLPIILVPILFFSQPFLRNANYFDPAVKANGKFVEQAVWIERRMPCNAPEALMDLLQKPIDAKVSDAHKRAAAANKAKMWGVTGTSISLYLLFALGSMIFYQWRKEREWDGR